MYTLSSYIVYAWPKYTVLSLKLRRNILIIYVFTTQNYDLRQKYSDCDVPVSRQIPYSRRHVSDLLPLFQNILLWTQNI